MRLVGFRCKYTSDSLFIRGICTCIYYYYFVTDINIEIIVIFSLFKLSRIINNCMHLSSLSRVTEPTLTAFTTRSLYYRR